MKPCAETEVFHSQWAHSSQHQNEFPTTNSPQAAICWPRQWAMGWNDQWCQRRIWGRQCRYSLLPKRTVVNISIVACGIQAQHPHFRCTEWQLLLTLSEGSSLLKIEFPNDQGEGQRVMEDKCDPVHTRRKKELGIIEIIDWGWQCVFPERLSHDCSCLWALSHQRVRPRKFGPAKVWRP